MESEPTKRHIREAKSRPSGTVRGWHTDDYAKTMGQYSCEVYRLKDNHYYHSRTQLAKNQTHYQQIFIKLLDESGTDPVYIERDSYKRGNEDALWAGGGYYAQVIMVEGGNMWQRNICSSSGSGS